MANRSGETCVHHVLAQVERILSDLQGGKMHYSAEDVQRIGRVLRDLRKVRRYRDDFQHIVVRTEMKR